MGPEEQIEKIKEKLRLTFGSQYKDEFQNGRISLAEEIANILEVEGE